MPINLFLVKISAWSKIFCAARPETHAKAISGKRQSTERIYVAGAVLDSKAKKLQLVSAYVAKNKAAKNKMPFKEYAAIKSKR